MQTSQTNHRARLTLIIPLVVFIIIADQLTKAWFVFKLGTHKAAGFGEFMAKYFAIWGDNGGTGAIHVHYFPFKPPIHVWQPWIDFNLTTNTGAAWSMFAGNSFMLSGVSLLMAVLLVYVWWRSFRSHLSMTWAMGGIIGGALGNFFDRFRLKEVVDFIDVRIPLIGQIFPSLGDPYDFPIFNVADSCAVVGTLALAIYLIVADIRHMRNRRHHDEPGSDEAVEPKQDETAMPVSTTSPAGDGMADNNGDEEGTPALAGEGETDGNQRT